MTPKMKMDNAMAAYTGLEKMTIVEISFRFGVSKTMIIAEARRRGVYVDRRALQISGRNARLARFFHEGMTAQNAAERESRETRSHIRAEAVIRSWRDSGIEVPEALPGVPERVVMKSTVGVSLPYLRCAL